MAGEQGNLNPSLAPSAPDVADMAAMEGRGKPVVLLRPRTAVGPLPSGSSRMGGDAHLPPDLPWPECPACRVPRQLVLQLFRRDVPEFPFPADDRDEFVLFRCPRKRCRTASLEKRFVWDYTLPERGVPRTQPNLPFEEPEPVPPALLKFLARGNSAAAVDRILAESWGPYEQPVRPCAFHPCRTIDYPTGYEDSAEWWGDAYVRFNRRWRFVESPAAWCETFWERVRAHPGTKVGGFPAWSQGAEYPQCRCGKTREFVFQLSSNDKNPDSPDRFSWSDHGIMIHDLGNVYFFACPACGPASLAASWDCG